MLFGYMSILYHVDSFVNPLFSNCLWQMKKYLAISSGQYQNFFFLSIGSESNHSQNSFSSFSKSSFIWYLREDSNLQLLVSQTSDSTSWPTEAKNGPDWWDRTTPTWSTAKRATAITKSGLLVLLEGIEPSPTVYHTVMLPLTPHQRYLVVLEWLEHSTSELSALRSYHLSYRTMEAGVRIELTTFVPGICNPAPYHPGHRPFFGP